MHDPDSQRVHATALEWYVDILQKERNTFYTWNYASSDFLHDFLADILINIWPLIANRQNWGCERWTESEWGIEPVAWPPHSRGAATPHWGCSGLSLWWHLWSPCWSAVWLHTAARRKAHPLFPAECGREVESKTTAVVILFFLCFSLFISN